MLKRVTVFGRVDQSGDQFYWRLETASDLFLRQ